MCGFNVGDCCRQSGVTDYYAKDDAHALHLARRVVKNLNRVKDPGVRSEGRPCGVTRGLGLGDTLGLGDVLGVDDTQVQGDAPSLGDVLGVADTQGKGDVLGVGDA